MLVVSCLGCTDKERETVTNETTGEWNEETATGLLPEQAFPDSNSDMTLEKPNGGDGSSGNSSEKETEDQPSEENKQEIPPQSASKNPGTSKTTTKTTTKKPADTPQQSSTNTGSSTPGRLELPTDWW